MLEEWKSNGAIKKNNKKKDNKRKRICVSRQKVNTSRHQVQSGRTAQARLVVVAAVHCQWPLRPPPPFNWTHCHSSVQWAWWTAPTDWHLNQWLHQRRPRRNQLNHRPLQWLSQRSIHRQRYPLSSSACLPLQGSPAPREDLIVAVWSCHCELTE